MCKLVERRRGFLESLRRPRVRTWEARRLMECGVVTLSADESTIVYGKMKVMEDRKLVAAGR
jgi:hypothetical protein